VNLSNPKVKENVVNGKLWSDLLKYHKAGYMMGAGSPAGKDTDVSSLGIVQGHAYALLRVIEESDSSGSHKLLQLRNPWGSTEWKGEWSDSDTKSWTQRMKTALNYNPEKEDSDDGLFWISFDDFLCNYEQIYVCRKFKTVEEGGTWYKYSAVSEWKGVTAGGCLNSSNKNAEFNPQFALPLTKPSNVFITLTQIQPGRDCEYLGLLLFNKDGKRAKAQYSNQIVARSDPGYTNVKSVEIEVSLIPGSKPFTIFPSLFHPGKECPFYLEVFSDQPLACQGNTLPLLDPATVPSA
jgi:hypothetical protein